jgi:hypothetical protein
MNVPGMEMRPGSTISPGGGIGRYDAKKKPGMAGDWTAQLTYDGPRETNLTMNVKP